MMHLILLAAQILAPVWGVNNVFHFIFAPLEVTHHTTVKASGRPAKEQESICDDEFANKCDYGIELHGPGRTRKGLQWVFKDNMEWWAQIEGYRIDKGDVHKEFAILEARTTGNYSLKLFDLDIGHSDDDFLGSTKINGLIGLTRDQMGRWQYKEINVHCPTDTLACECRRQNHYFTISYVIFPLKMVRETSTLCADASVYNCTVGRLEDSGVVARSLRAVLHGKAINDTADMAYNFIRL